MLCNQNLYKYHKKGTKQSLKRTYEITIYHKFFNRFLSFYLYIGLLHGIKVRTIRYDYVFSFGGKVIEMKNNEGHNNKNGKEYLNVVRPLLQYPLQ